MAENGAEAAFEAFNHGVLRAAGLAGESVRGVIRNQALELHGAERGVLRVAPEDIERIRVGYLEGKRRAYAVRIWCRGRTKALYLEPHVHTWPAYTMAIATLAALMIERGGIDRIEGGYSKLDALLGPSLFGMLTLGMTGIAVFALTNEPWWGRVLVPLIPLALFLALARAGIARHWPRRIADFAELEGQLPPLTDKVSIRDRLWFLAGGRGRT